MKIIIGTVAGFALGLGVAGVFAATNAPYYEVTEINVKDQTAYEASGVNKVREGIKENGGKIIARLQQGNKLARRAASQPLPYRHVPE